MHVTVINLKLTMNFKESEGECVCGRILREERNDTIITFKKNKKVHVFTKQ